VEIFDITVPVRPGMPVYEDDPPVTIETVASIAAGDSLNLSRIAFGLHTGTHIDAPRHFIESAPGVDQLPLDALVGSVEIVDATAFDHDIDATALATLGIPPRTERVLFKTRNSRFWDLDPFSPNFIGLTEGAATELVRSGVRLVGIDYLSIAPFADPAPTHLALLRAGVVVVEGLDLRGVAPGQYTLVCLPLKIVGADGTPARVILTRP